jgi:hypothetical protein
VSEPETAHENHKGRAKTGGKDLRPKRPNTDERLKRKKSSETKSDPEDTQPETETKIVTQIWHHHK